MDKRNKSFLTFYNAHTGRNQQASKVSRSSFDSEVYRILNASIPLEFAPHLFGSASANGLMNCEIVVEGANIASLQQSPPCTQPSDLPSFDAAGGIVLPRFVDVHTHLDRAHMWARSPNLDGTFAGARNAAIEGMEKWRADDIRQRMEFSLACAYSHGTGAIRTHLDWIGEATGLSWSVFAETREHWKGKMTLQAAALFPVELAVDDEAQFLEIVRTVVKYEGVLGGVTCLDEAPGPKLELALDRLFKAATANGLDLDLHVDETLSLRSCSLERIAIAAVRNRFNGKILAGHCCSLASAPEEDLWRIIDRVREAHMAVVSLPMCNMYLQDRAPGRTPRLRGVTPVHELDSAGIPVLIASDNVQDPFYPYGDLDMLEVFREATRILHLDHSNRPWINMLGKSAADLAGIPTYGRVAVGQPADLVITSARTIWELLSRPQSDRLVLVTGRLIESGPPDYRELDEDRIRSLNR